MASEILRRNPTSTGNRRVFTWAGWVKFNKLSTVANCIWYAASSGSSEFNISLVSSTGALNVYDYAPSAYQYQYVTSRLLRDFSNWFHLVVAVDTTQFREDDRFKIYINGALYNGSYSTEITVGGINHNTRMNTPGEINTIGQNISGGVNYDANCELADMFMVDGQALTPDVFGFYKQGKGYISVGSTQATDFRPGQWVPKTPRVIKTEINRRGGFGVNGFYLPMNDSNNFGADFHCDPNSIITLNEKLPQPRVGVATTASVGLGYTDALRADPYAANLLVACPFVSGGLGTDGTVSATIPGLGDYHRVLGGQSNAPVNFAAGSGTQATVAIGTGVYYGSSLNVTASTIRPRATVGTALTIVNDYTVEFWAYVNSFAADGSHFVQYDTDAGATGWLVSGDYGQPRFTLRNSSGADKTIRPSVGIFTTGQWNHFAAVYQRSKGLMNLYLNGTSVGIVTDVPTNYPSTQYSGLNRLIIGTNSGDGSRPMLGYMQDLRIYNTAKYTGGFDVPRPYTPVGIATWRAVPDTTANNFATLNPLIGAGVNAGDTVPALLSGNLYLDNANQTWAPATIGVSTGKWYAEFMCLNGVQSSNIGVSGDSIAFRNSQDFFNKVGVSYVRLASSSITKQFTSTSFTSGSIGYTSGDIVGVTLDVTNKEIKFFKNNVGIFTDTTLSGFTTTNTHYYFTPFRTNDGSSGADWSDVVANFGQNPTFSGNTTAGTFTDSNGKGLFKYQPPSGFLALCEDNLPTPAISDPGKYFKTVLWTGTGKDNGGTGTNGAKPIVGIGFTPDLVWIKNRDNAEGHWWWDSVRGFVPNGGLRSNLTDAETNTSGKQSYVSGASADGFSITENSPGSNGGEVNYNGRTYVAWCWRAGAGTTSTNTNGSVTSVVSVNQDAGFSIVSWTAADPAGDNTIGHGLGKPPKFIICKSRTSGTDHWVCYHSTLGKDNYILLSSTNASGASANYWSSSVPSSTVFGVANSTSTSNNVGNMIAYCWAEIEGFSKFGSYVGNGNADGPMVWCGFKPAFVMIKRSDSTGNWCIHDSSRGPVNVMNEQLQANLSNVESGTGGLIDFLSNGFKIRATSTDLNTSGNTYIFAAFAESPFTTANAK